MTHDFNKPPHTESSDETTQKKRIPVYILVLIGIFFIALIIYMSAGIKPDASDTPPERPAAQAQTEQSNSATATAQDDATATDSATATASDH
jgi:flagellar basal body-associated protein FliL